MNGIVIGKKEEDKEERGGEGRKRRTKNILIISILDPLFVSPLICSGGDPLPLGVDTLNPGALCMAPPYPGAGLRCVDTEDAGTREYQATRINDNCNVIEAYYIYTEPFTQPYPCPDPPETPTLCYPSITFAEITRSGDI